MNFDERLAQYRQSYGKERQAVNEVVDHKKVEFDILDQELDFPVMKDLAPTWGEIDMPTAPMRHSDENWTGDEATDKANFLQYMKNDPLMRQYGPQMQGLLMELDTQMMDPENPMTPEEATQAFTDLMEQNFYQYFQ